MYLNHNEISILIKNQEMIDTSDDCINAASLDVRLGDHIMVEVNQEDHGPFKVVYKNREKLKLIDIPIPDHGYVIEPGQFFLAHTIEKCNFADDTAALFRIKSSMGRIGLEHMDAGWVDPGFHGSLTLEFKNVTENHRIVLHRGDRIGQLIFLKGNPVTEEQSYRNKGNYNGETGIAQVRYKDKL